MPCRRRSSCSVRPAGYDDYLDSVAHADLAAPLATPRLPFNGRMSARRSVAFRDLPLARVKDIAHASGTHVNDVILAVLAGTLRDWLLSRDELPDQALVAAVPVSTRGPEELLAPGNHVSACFVHLPIHLADPRERSGSHGDGGRPWQGRPCRRRAGDPRAPHRARGPAGAVGARRPVPALRPGIETSGPGQPGRVERGRAAIRPLPRRTTGHGVLRARPHLRRCGSEHHRHLVPRPARFRLRRLPRSSPGPGERWRTDSEAAFEELAAAYAA